MEKSADAFRSIGETARLIGVAPHVLRYWETQFPQLKPVKRNDGRRYYRPDDVRLAAGLYELLREEGLTIRGAKKQIARDRGEAVRVRGARRLGDAMLPEIAGATADNRASTDQAPRTAVTPPRRKRRAPDDSTLPLFPASAETGGDAQPVADHSAAASLAAPVLSGASADPAPSSALPRLMRLRRRLDVADHAPDLPVELPRKLRELNDILSASL